MGADEEGTHERLRTNRDELLDATIAVHHGRLVKTTEDGLLVEFGSAFRVRCCGKATERERLAAKRQNLVPSMACYCGGDGRDKRPDQH
jgi:class 3 adenylate cyclase